MTTLADMFAQEIEEGMARARAELTAGTREYAQSQALTLASAQRDADKLARSLAAGLVVGVTCTEKGDPLAEASEDEDEDEDEGEEEGEAYAATRADE